MFFVSYMTLYLHFLLEYRLSRSCQTPFRESMDFKTKKGRYHSPRTARYLVLNVTSALCAKSFEESD